MPILKDDPGLSVPRVAWNPKSSRPIAHYIPAWPAGGEQWTTCGRPADRLTSDGPEPERGCNECWLPQIHRARLDIEFAYTPWESSCRDLLSPDQCCRRPTGHTGQHGTGYGTHRTTWAQS